MNDDPKNSISQSEIDRLVDGVLSPSQYQALIRQLDACPDGWRRCALAFLENQALQLEFSRIMNTPLSPENAEGESAALDCQDETADGKALANRSGTRSWLAPTLARWSSVVAVGLATFLFAFALRSGAFRNRDGGTPPAASDISRSNVDRVVDPSSSIESESRFASLQLDDPVNGNDAEFQVPLQFVNRSDATDKDIGSYSLPPQIESVLEGNPQRYARERRVMTFVTADGDVFVLPFDEIWVRGFQ